MKWGVRRSVTARVERAYNCFQIPLVRRDRRVLTLFHLEHGPAYFSDSLFAPGGGEGDRGLSGTNELSSAELSIAS